MTFLRHFLTAVVLSIVLISCKKDKNEYPEVKTLTLSTTTANKVLFTGKIINKGDFEVIDYGFIYSSSSYIDETSSVKISLGNSPSVGDFSKETEVYSNSAYNNQIYARAYITNSQGTAYGNILSVTLPTSSASNIMPTVGKVGDLIEILGQFYASNASQVRVTFGGVNAKIVSFSNTKITVEVPTGINVNNYSNNNVPVYVFINNSQLSSGYTFKINPIVTDFLPKSANYGSTIRIYGENFSSYYNSIQVFFDNIQAQFNVNSTSELIVTVPSGLLTSKSKISVIINGIKTALADDFTLIMPTITSMSPTVGSLGTAVELYGTGFPSITPSITVGGYAATSVSNYGSRLTFSLPSSLPEGDHEVKVNFSGLILTVATKFKMVYPSITSFAPLSGVPGETVTIKGFGFTQYSQVKFGSISATVLTSNATEIKATVPSNLPAGPMKITVTTNNGQTVVSTDNFTKI